MHAVKGPKLSNLTKTDTLDMYLGVNWLSFDNDTNNNEIFLHFSQFLHADSVILLKLDHSCFLPHSFRLTIYLVTLRGSVVG
jgi:hypothetical protein